MPAPTVSALNAPTGFAGEAHNKFEQKTGSSALLALGIVYGDLGTSPLYALQAIVRIMGDQFTPEGLC
jgi:KUP system potassium uptake protein